MTKLYGWLAGIVAVLAIVGVIYGKGRLDQSHKEELAAVQSQLTLVTEQVRNEQAARRLDAQKAFEAADQLRVLNSRATSLQEYASALEDANRECLSGTDTERLRDLWR